jgi:hypothetical protein
MLRASGAKSPFFMHTIRPFIKNSNKFTCCFHNPVNFYLFICCAGVEPSPLIGLLYNPWVTNSDDFEAINEMNEWQGQPKYWEEKTFLGAALSTRDPTHDLTRAGTQVTEVASRRLTSRAASLPSVHFSTSDFSFQ